MRLDTGATFPFFTCKKDICSDERWDIVIPSPYMRSFLLQKRKDGKIMIELHRTDGAGAGRTLITEPEDTLIRDLQWSCSAEAIYYRREGLFRNSRSQIVRYDLNSAEQTVIFSTAGKINGFSLSEDERVLAVLRYLPGTAFQTEIEIYKDGTPYDVIWTPGSPFDPQVSRDGKKIVYLEGIDTPLNSLMLYDVETKERSLVLRKGALDSHMIY